MSPLQTSMLASSILFIAAKVMTSLLETAAHADLVSYNVGVLITIGSVISGSGYLAAYCRDCTAARIRLLEYRIGKIIDAYGQQCLEDGLLDSARQNARAIAAMDSPPQRDRPDRGHRFSLVDRD